MDISDIEQGLQSLDSYFKDLPDNITTNIDITADTDIIETVKTDLDGLGDKDIDVNLSGNAEDAINNIRSDLDSLDNKDVDVNITGDAETEIQNISNELTALSGGIDIPVTVSGEGLNELSTNAANASDTLDTTTNSTTGLEGALAGLVGIGAAKWISDTVDAAGGWQDQWSRLGIAVREPGKSLQELQGEWGPTITNMAEDTGRGASVIREQIIGFGRAGITSKEIMEDSMSSISGAAYVAKVPIESVGDAFDKVVQRGTGFQRVMTTLGISTQDVMDATGMSMEEFNKKLKEVDPNTRAAMMSQVINFKYGEAANEEYRDSWQHTTDQVGISMGYLERVLGQPIFGTFKAGVETGTGAIMGFAKWLEKLPEPFRTGITLALDYGLALITFAGAAKTLEALPGDLTSKLAKIPQTITDYMYKPIDFTLKQVSKLIPDSVKGWVDDLLNFKNKLSETFGKGESVKFKVEMDDSGLKGKLVEEESRISRFVDTIKTKADELKSKINPKQWFSSESLDTEIKTQESRLGKFVDDVKGKVNELKTNKFKFSDIFGGEDTSSLDKLKTKIESTVNTVKSKWDTLKGKLNISDWFKDEKGTADFGKIVDDLVTKIMEKLPKFETVGRGIPESLARGFRAALPTLVSRIGADGPMIAIALIQTLSTDIKEHWQKSLPDLIKEMFGLDLWKALLDAVGLGGIASYIWHSIMDPLDKLTKGFMEKFLKKLFGEKPVEEFENYWNKNIMEPMRKQLDLFFKDPIKYLLGDNVKPISLMDIIFGKKEEGKEDPFLTYLNDAKTKITQFVDDTKKKFEELKGAFNIDWGGLKGNLEESIKWVRDRFTEFEQFLDTIPDKMYSYGERILQRLVDGLQSKMGPFKDILQFISDHWPKSPAKLGPLSEDIPKNMEKYGSSIVTSLGSGIKSSTPDIVSSLMSIADELNLGDITVNKALSMITNFVRSQGIGNMPLSDAKEWASNLIDGMSSGLSSGKSGLSSALEGIADYFPRSPAKTGPLSEVTKENIGTWAQDLARSAVAGVYYGVTSFGYNASPTSTYSQWNNPQSSSTVTPWQGLNITNPYPVPHNTGAAWMPEGWTSKLFGDNFMGPMFDNFNLNLGDSSSAVQGFTDSIGQASLGLGEWSAGQGMLMPGAGWNAGPGKLMSARDFPQGSPGKLMGAFDWDSYLHKSITTSEKATDTCSKAISSSRLGWGKADININVNEGAVQVKGTGSKLGGSSDWKSAGSKLGKAVADEIHTSLKNNGIIVERW